MSISQDCLRLTLVRGWLSIPSWGRKWLLPLKCVHQWTTATLTVEDYHVTTSCKLWTIVLNDFKQITLTSIRWLATSLQPQSYHFDITYGQASLIICFSFTKKLDFMWAGGNFSLYKMLQIRLSVAIKVGQSFYLCFTIFLSCNRHLLAGGDKKQLVKFAWPI